MTTATVNGETRPLGEGTTVADLIASLGHDPGGRGVAAAVNGEVTPRSAWASTVVADGDRVEILAAIGGG
ncbi:MAG TPA: sulfur carrier protein ThiS [Actinomycetota bacterium]|nr:sulfur carrier protein ThiS [Actinomycetota bacterium]